MTDKTTAGGIRTTMVDAKRTGNSMQPPHPTTQMAPNVGSCVAEKWPMFDPEDIDSFLDEFEKQADTHGKIRKRRCAKLKECLPAEVASEVIFFHDYEGGDWDMLKVSLWKAYPQKPVMKMVYQQKLDELTAVEKQEGGGFGLDPELKTILTKVSKMELRVKLGELVQISPMLRKGVLSLLKTKKAIGSKASVQKVHSTEVPVGCHEWKRLLYSTGIGSVNGTLEGWKVQFTLDDGLEVNLMSQAVVGELA
ncbi:hypothetical protein IWQ61_009905 [Dispira simplex]|nr:hypothetical protein IWQ61_009905 [Dispira simplex]